MYDMNIRVPLLILYVYVANRVYTKKYTGQKASHNILALAQFAICRECFLLSSSVANSTDSKSTSTSASGDRSQKTLTTLFSHLTTSNVNDPSTTRGWYYLHASRNYWSLTILQRFNLSWLFSAIIANI